MPEGFPTYQKVDPDTGEVTNVFVGEIQADGVNLPFDSDLNFPNIEPDSTIHWVKDGSTAGGYLFSGDIVADPAQTWAFTELMTLAGEGDPADTATTRMSAYLGSVNLFAQPTYLEVTRSPAAGGNSSILAAVAGMAALILDGNGASQFLGSANVPRMATRFGKSGPGGGAPVWAGTGGWAAVRTGLGQYNINLTLPAGYVPRLCLAICHENGVADIGLSVSGIVGNTVQIRTWDRVAGSQDRAFAFLAISTP